MSLYECRFGSSSGKEVYSPDGTQSKGHRGDCGWRNPESTIRYLVDVTSLVPGADCLRWAKGICMEYGVQDPKWYMLEARTSHQHTHSDGSIGYQ